MSFKDALKKMKEQTETGIIIGFLQVSCPKCGTTAGLIASRFANGRGDVVNYVCRCPICDSRWSVPNTGQTVHLVAIQTYEVARAEEQHPEGGEDE